MASLRPLLIVVVALSVSLSPAWAVAEDSVKVRFNSGYPPPDRSSEFVTLTVSRIPAATAGHETDVDRFFEAVRVALADGEVPPEWGLLAIDVPFVAVDITLGERHFALAANYGEEGAFLPHNATASDKRVATAFQRVLELTLDRVGRDLHVK